MCTPAALIRRTDDQLLELLTQGLAELQRRHRPTPANSNFLAAARGVQAALAQLERFHEHIAAGAGDNKVHRVIDTLEPAEVPTFLRRAGAPG